VRGVGEAGDVGSDGARDGDGVDGGEEFLERSVVGDGLMGRRVAVAAGADDGFEDLGGGGLTKSFMQKRSS
jgi:hypothetical protein